MASSANQLKGDNSSSRSNEQEGVGGPVTVLVSEKNAFCEDINFGEVIIKGYVVNNKVAAVEIEVQNGPDNDQSKEGLLNKYVQTSFGQVDTENNQWGGYKFWDIAGKQIYYYKIKSNNDVDYFVYTDGACKGNPGPGGWGALIMDGDSRKELYAGNPDTTNNQMEMQAAIEALKYLKGTSELIELYTDSNYLRQGITEWIVNWKLNNWRTASKKPVANKGLWIEVDELSNTLNIEGHWVKGHAGYADNELVDELARNAIPRK